MDDWVFALQLGAIVSVVVLIALWAVTFALRASHSGAEPVIKVTGRKLDKGWYQVLIAVSNRAPPCPNVRELARRRIRVVDVSRVRPGRLYSLRAR